MSDHVIIVGGGFSGALQAINLLRHGGPHATLIERGDTPALGIAYGAAHPDHILNVRAGNMSALPDDPGHFARWLTARGVADAGHAFIARRTYGTYLRELLHETHAAAPDRLNIVHGNTVHLAREGERAVATLSDGRRVTGSAAVLAVGNLPPHTPPGIDATLDGGRYVADPWAPGVTDGLCDDDGVAIIGAGLTMVDVALMLDAAGFRGRILAMSRRGLLPRVHEAPPPAWERRADRPRATGAALLREVRARGRAIGWRQAVDELRPFTQAMWANADAADRGRFLRHLRPWWDVHRHRLAPEVHERLQALIAGGRLTVAGGRPVATARDGAGVALTWRPRGAAADRTDRVARIINATGPQGDITRTREPLLRDLYDAGLIRPDSARIGIDVAPDAATIARDGTRSSWLYALGPMTRGAFWEIVAVPDIRVQAWSLARRLSNAHWVEGAGL